MALCQEWGESLEPIFLIVNYLSIFSLLFKYLTKSVYNDRITAVLSKMVWTVVLLHGV